jgi:hypothetical protein
MSQLGPHATDGEADKNSTDIVVAAVSDIENTRQ